MLDKLTIADFSPYLNKQLHVSSESTESFDMELIEVSGIGTASTATGDTEKRQPFSIIFLGPEQPVLQQGIYEIKHDNFGPFDIFIVPIGPDTNKQGILYEAVFN